MCGVRIEQAAKQLKVSTSTLRRLEKDGLFKASRNRGGHRVYDEAALKELEKIIFSPRAEG